MKNKQVFKNQTLTRTKVKNNILKIWNLSEESDRFDWYGDALNFATNLGKSYNVETFKVCGIIAALSPRSTWDYNKRLTVDYLNGSCRTMQANLNKCNRIMQASDESEILGILNGPKTSSFFLNILRPYDNGNVTIDRHAVSIALNRWIDESEYNMTEIQYNFFKDCYIYTAGIIGVPAVLLQSATWVVWRRIKTEYR